MWTQDKRGNYAIRERKTRVSQILSTLKKAKEENIEVDMIKFRAELSIRFGISSRKVTEYLKELHDAEQILVDTNDVGEEIVQLK